jgi:pimeloyl-ACP methyl ester carboxylesterase
VSDSLPGYPGRGHWRRVPKTGQHYVDVGAGDPVLFLHGNPSWSYLWRHLLTALAPEHRCVAADWPGMGLSARSPMPAAPADRLARHLTQLDALFEHLVAAGLPDRGWTFALHDWGGPLGLAWARRQPGVLGRLVALNTVGFRFPPDYRLPPHLRWIRDSRTVAGLVHTTNLFARAAVLAGVTRRLPAPVRRAYLRPYRRRRNRSAVVEFVRAIPGGDPNDPVWRLLDPADPGADAALAGLPTFVGWGMRDPVFTPALLTEWERRFPHARVHRYPDAGHFVTEDAAGDLGRDLVAFLRETEAR